ncbi:MAG: hypothetical protein Q8M16_14640 [Pirellulaceae bacterium]|nr:hypothetical protein [Pirellulaceae bacterium]
MLTEVLDRWDILVELQQQKATWQQRWDRAQTAFEQSLLAIDPRDAQRLRRVLEESLPQALSGTAIHPGPTAVLEESPPASHDSSDSNIDEAHLDEPTTVELASVEESEVTLDELLAWAADVVGDGVSENVLFQELRKSKYSSHARLLFDALKERDAFYQLDDEIIRVYSLRSLSV